jgi:hypothetical protein
MMSSDGKIIETVRRVAEGEGIEVNEVIRRIRERISIEIRV